MKVLKKTIRNIIIKNYILMNLKKKEIKYYTIVWSIYDATFYITKL